MGYSEIKIGIRYKKEGLGSYVIDEMRITSKYFFCYIATVLKEINAYLFPIV